MTSCQWLSQGNLSWIYFYRKFLRRLNNYYHKNDCILTAFSGSTVHPSYYGDSCCIAIFVKQLVNDLKKIHIEKKPNTTQSQQLFLPQFPQQPVQKAACDCPEPPPLCLFMHPIQRHSMLLKAWRLSPPFASTYLSISHLFGN